MGQNLVMTGMVLNAMPIGDYDKRITLLTRERGKITAFARGARKPNSQFLAATNPFSFGEFELFEGRSTYTVAKVSIQNYFRELAADFNAAYYGFYFLEFADYYGRENADDLEMLKLLYQTVRALCKKTIAYPLIRCIYELKIMAVNGECPHCFECACCHCTDPLTVFSSRYSGLLCGKCAFHEKMTTIPVSPAAVYTMQYIISTPVEKLYTFTVSDEVLENLKNIIERYRNQYIDRRFKSLEILTMMEDM